MKNLILIVSILFIANSSFAGQINQAVQNGDWTVTTTWSLSRTPLNGDSVVIPANKIVTISGDENLKNSVLQIAIYGTLSFVGGGAKLNLADNSNIIVYPLAQITSDQNSNSSKQTIKIGNNKVFSAADHGVAGPELASSITNGFVPFSMPIVSLPVKFISFTVSLTSNQVLIQWSTGEEINTSSYEVEKSTDAKNWNTIAYVMASGNSNSTNNYSYKDNASSSVVYYRIKETDQNGKEMYTAVKSIKVENTVAQSEIKIGASNHTLFIQFAEEIKGNVVVRFISLNGMVLNQQIINNPVGQIVISPSSSIKGNYIISVSNNSTISLAKQVIL